MRKQIFTILFLASTIFATVSKAQDASENSTKEFQPSGNVYGYVFADYYTKMHADSLNRGGGNVQYRGVPKNFNAFQVRRAYLGYDFNITENFSTSVLLADEEGPSNAAGLPANTPNLVASNTGTNVDNTGSNTMYLKYAYLKWSNIFKNSNLKIGQYQTASFATGNGTEQLWGYRSIERTIMDMHNNDASSDLGLSLEGNVWTEQNAANPSKPTYIGYIAQIGNGSSAKPETDEFKKVRANLFVNTLDQKLVVGWYGDFNQTKLQPVNQYTSTMKVYANYKTEWFKIGAELFQQLNKNGDNIKTVNNVNGAGGIKDSTWADGMQTGVSVFLSGRIINKKLNYFARFDMYNPDSKYNKNDTYGTSTVGGNMTTTTFYTQKFVTLGLDYTPISRVHIMPNIWYNQYDAMMSDVAGKAIGSNAKSSNDFVARITCYYIFNAGKSVSNNGMDY